MKGGKVKYLIRGFVGVGLIRCAFLMSMLLIGVGVNAQESGRAADTVLSGSPKHEKIVATLGGRDVEIPKAFASFVEFDGDAGWSGPKRGSAKRGKNIRSFGFYIKFPEMIGLESSALRLEKKKSKIDKTSWIFVGVNSGEHFAGHGYLDRLMDGSVWNGSSLLPFEHYKKLDESEFGLDVYAPDGNDPLTNVPHRKNMYASDIYIRESSKGVVTYIKCSNRETLAPPCRHNFSLEPDMGAAVYVSYRRQLLPQWKEIQESIRKKILSFSAR